MLKYTNLDERLRYYIDKHNDIFFEEYNSLDKYNNRNLAAFYETNQNESLAFDKKSGFILNKKDNIVFIPLYKKIF